MTRIFDDPTEFTDDLLDGFVAANRQYVARADGGVVRSSDTPEGRVAVVIGGGSGHYPAFAGLVGPGLAAASACGNIFASPSVAQVYRVARLANRGGGILLSYGNYAGDVLNFDEAQERLRADGIDVRTVLGTDDIASGSIDEITKRRGIAGELALFKVAGAAAEAGMGLDEVERLARKANDRTRTLGVAFAGCTLPGASEPLFTVPEGEMSIGLGIHGEPGISSIPMPSASELAKLLVERLLAERPEDAGTRVVPILNGLGTIKYDELFVLFGKIAVLLEAEGLEIVEPECGELVTSLDMSGLSLSLFWIDDELAALWAAPADTPAYRKGWVDGSRPAGATGATRRPRVELVEAEPAHEDATPASVDLAGSAARLLGAVEDTIAQHADELGRLDAIAGDGDHGIGMTRGAKAAAAAAKKAVADHRGVHETLMSASDEWSERAGGTSGALWAAAIAAVAKSLGNRESYGSRDIAAAGRAALDAITTRGKAVAGDKTMVDAFIPWVDALERGDDLTTAAKAATEAAEATSSLTPRLGRARPLAEKSLGHPDAGAISFALIVTRIAAESETK